MSSTDPEGSQQREAEARHLHAFLRTAILFGALAAGTAVTIHTLVRRHRVSPGAAREALVRLQDEGLVSQETDGAVVVGDADQSNR